MDIEELVKKHLDVNWCGEDSTGYDDVAEAMRAALTELSAKYEDELKDLRMCKIAAQEEARRVDELTAELERLRKNAERWRKANEGGQYCIAQWNHAQKNGLTFCHQLPLNASTPPSPERRNDRP